MKIESIKYMLMAQDMERAIRFYEDVLGFSVVVESPMWTELALNGAIVALHGGGDDKFRQTGLSIQVADIYAACAEIESGGGGIMSKPVKRTGEPIILAKLADTEGNGFSLSQYVG